jgi:choice-of-anchor A domain-containing protein
MKSGGGFRRRVLPLAAGALVTAIGALVLVPGVAGAAANCVSLGNAGNYAEYTTAGAAVDNETVQGSAAYGSDSSLTSSTIASLAGPPASQDTLVVGGALGSSGGTVAHGSAIYVGSLTGSISTPGGGTVTQVPLSSLPFPFPTAQSALVAASGTFSSFTSTGTTTTGSTVTFTGSGTGTSTNVFSLAGTTLKAGTTLDITAPVGAVVVINVTGTASLALKNQTVTLSGGVVAANVLWSFDAGALTLTSEKWQGTVLQPNGTMAVTSSTVTGSLLGGATGQFTGNTVDLGLFTGCVPPNLGAATPEAPLTILLPLSAVAIGGLFYLFRRRKQRIGSIRIG